MGDHYSGIPGLPESITCPECNMTSYNANDIAQGWCGGCKDYTSEPQADDVRHHVAMKFRPVRQRGYEDDAFCPMGCGGVTEDVTGGPCSSCWQKAPR